MFSKTMTVPVSCTLSYLIIGINVGLAFLFLSPYLKAFANVVSLNEMI